MDTDPLMVADQEAKKGVYIVVGQSVVTLITMQRYVLLLHNWDKEECVWIQRIHQESFWCFLSSNNGKWNQYKVTLDFFIILRIIHLWNLGYVGLNATKNLLTEKWGLTQKLF